MKKRLTTAILVAVFGLTSSGCKTVGSTSSDIESISQRTCAISSLGIQGIPELLISRHSPDKDLPYLSVRLASTHDETRIYYSPGLLSAAESKAECLGTLLALLRTEIPERRLDVSWASVVITASDTYIPDRTSGETRWHISLPNGVWDESAIKMLTLVIPHEQVHQSQRSQRELLSPRWFHEGHAEWAALKVTDQIRPDLSSAERANLSHEASKLPPSASLISWGGIRPKKEAYERQLSSDDRARLAADPTFQPRGPFTFGPDDLIQDNSNEKGRYGAALSLFERLEREHGKDAVLGWVRLVLDSEDNAQIVPLATRVFGEDISDSLK